MTDAMDWDRLARFVSGEADHAERLAVEAWMAAAPGNRAAVDAVRRRWNAAAGPATWDVEGAWQRLQPRLDHAAEPVVRALPRAGARSWARPSRLIPLAAAAVLVLAVVLRSPDSGSDPAVATTAAGASFRTGVGERRSIDLPDGSQVVLGAASTLRLEDRYGERSRQVYLEGQAFVKVTHDAARPFVVIAGGTRTVDLGTAFEVRAYPSEAIRVAVTEGSVEVRREDGDTAAVAVLRAGDVARLDAASGAEVQRQQDVQRLLGWTRGQLSFDDAPLSDVARELERWFDVECRIDSREVGNLHFSVDLRIGESLDEILTLVEYALLPHGVRAERVGRTVTFRTGAPVTPAVRPARRAEVGA